MAIANLVRKITVFLGSPSDVEVERGIVDEAVQDLNVTFGSSRNIVIELRRWELHTWPGFGADAQDVINAQIGDYDIFVGIFWNRFGTPTTRALSGSAEEFERAYALWQQHKRPALMLYFRQSPATISTIDELQQKQRVIEFKAALTRRGGFFSEYDTVEEFKRMVGRQLALQIAALDKSAEVSELNQRVDAQQQRINEQDEHLEKQRRIIDELVKYSMAGYIYAHLRGIYFGQRDHNPPDYKFRKNPAMEHDIRFLRDHGYIEFLEIGGLADETDLVKLVKLTPVGEFYIRLREGID